MNTVTITVSERQTRILSLLEQGLSQKEIAAMTDIPLSQVKIIIYSMCAQWECKNTTHLVAWAIRNSVI